LANIHIFISRVWVLGREKGARGMLKLKEAK
jgi:hypothetical protein